MIFISPHTDGEEEILPYSLCLLFNKVSGVKRNEILVFLSSKSQ
jgi:hypothetical protein